MGAAVRAWVPACATGEEAYSLAMLLLEDSQVNERRLRLQVFATDIDAGALEVARKGVVSRIDRPRGEFRAAAAVFQPVEGGYQVSQAAARERGLRSTERRQRPAVLAHGRHQLPQSPDLHGAGLQRRVLQSFHFGLEQDGMLALGKAETIGARRSSSRRYAAGAHLPPCGQRVGPPST